MEQKVLESQLAELEANYIVKKTAVEDKIRNTRIAIEDCNKIHAMHISEYKSTVLDLEKELAAAKMRYAVERAEVMKRFCE